LGPGWGSSVGAACSGVGSGSARRTLKVETQTAAAIARSDAPPRRRLAMSATTAGVNRDGPLGPSLVLGKALGAGGVKFFAPAPQGDGGDPERGSHLHCAGRLDAHQLDRCQPPTQVVAGVPHEGQLTADEHPPAAVVGHQGGRVPDQDCACRGQGKGPLGSPELLT
jgi:hypothetical protein